MLRIANVSLPGGSTTRLDTVLVSISTVIVCSCHSDPVKDVTGWPANPNLVRHLKSTLIWTGVHVDEAVMGLSVHTDEDGGGANP